MRQPSTQGQSQADVDKLRATTKSAGTKTPRGGVSAPSGQHLGTCSSSIKIKEPWRYKELNLVEERMGVLHRGQKTYPSWGSMTFRNVEKIFISKQNISGKKNLEKFAV